MFFEFQAIYRHLTIPTSVNGIVNKDEAFRLRCSQSWIAAATSKNTEEDSLPT